MPLTKVSSRAIEDTLRYVLGANGTSDYTFTGPGLSGAVNDPTLTLSRGHTYIFENRSGGHPFYIKTSIANGGTQDAYNTGVTNNGGGNGTEIIFTVPHDAPDLLYYQCSSHSSMAGQLKIVGAVADGSITTAKLAADAVTSDKIADDAVTAAKIADNSITAAQLAPDSVSYSELAVNAVGNENINSGAISSGKMASSSVATAAIQDQAVTLDKLPHGTSSNDGKFLRANNGADPTFESISTRAGRNIVINGNFKIAQRAASHGSSGYRTVDRWKMSAGGANAALTQSQYSAISGTSPYAEGHHQAYRIENAGQNANTQGYVSMLQNIEAQDIVSSGWNFKSSSSYITLSFWIRSSVTQTHLVSLITNDGTLREWNHLVSLTSDQWTKVTMTIPGDSNITVNNDNGIGLTLYFHAYLGSHYTSGSTVDQWVTHAGYTSRPDMGAGWGTTSNATFMLTGVQLEAGSVATVFEHRSFSQELALCQRYFFKNINESGENGANYAKAYNDTELFTSVKFPVAMRATPTVTAYSNSGTAGQVHKLGSPDVSYNAIDRLDVYGGFRFTGSSGTWATGDTDMYSYTFQADAEL